MSADVTTAGIDGPSGRFRRPTKPLPALGGTFGWLTLGLAAVAAMTTAAPLAVYGVAIALFGLPHVLAELRFLDIRYGADVGRSVLRPVIAILAAACALRLAGSYGWVPRGLAVPGELTLVAASAWPLQRCLGRRRWLAWAAMGGIAAAASVAPFSTLLALSAAHNLTPVAFVGDALRRRPGRRRAALAALVVFGVLPATIVLGLAGLALTALGVGIHPEAAIMPSGALARTLGTVVPPEVTDPQLALNLFAAAVYLQCAHYVAVIWLMPRLLNASPAPPRLRGWPRHSAMVLALAAVGVVTALAFFADFGNARRVYAVLAAFHSWIEVPILLLLLGGRLRPGPDAGG